MADDSSLMSNGLASKPADAREMQSYAKVPCRALRVGVGVCRGLRVGGVGVGCVGVVGVVGVGDGVGVVVRRAGGGVFC